MRNRLDMLTADAAERQIREERLQREARDRADDRKQRERLERASPSAPRLSFVQWLNGQSNQRAAAAVDGVNAIEEIRRMQALNRRTPAQHNRAHEAFVKGGGLGAFTRLGSGTVNTARDTPLPDRDVGGPGPRSRIAQTRFEIGPNDPGRNRTGRFGGFEDGGPVLKPGERVGDAEGRLRGGNRDHWPSGALEVIDPAFLLDVARALKSRGIKFKREEEYDVLTGVVYDFRAEHRPKLNGCGRELVLLLFDNSQGQVFPNKK